MEGKSTESGAAEESAPPSVARLAGLFGDTLNSPRKEVPPQKPTRRKPPCSLPLPKVEVVNNGDEKLSPPQSQVPKVKVKSSPLIEKLQANLAFAPASLLPGTSPKSPGLKAMASPWSTPPSTPTSPGLQPHSSSAEESPVSFEQPPEGAPLQSYTKIRTRGSIKRRPPSRKFRKSQSDMDFDIETANATAKENGDKTDNEADAAQSEKTDGDASPAAENSPNESANKTSESQESVQPNPDKQEEASPDEGEKSDKEEEKTGASETEKPDTEQETLVIEEKSEDPGEGADKEESHEQNKSDEDDKPEK
ncbi:capZ-interacting protein [Hyla sarda]|uniref:capZ-interacting protein n=1 Tax=Hyla sarda TaxID=327740 RepID=UPI0024C3953D|nr:capZ-interacting protein [Hyla sarda]